MQQITSCLWFEDNAEEAATYYTGIFKHSKITQITRYSDVGQEIHGRPPGSVMVVAFEINGRSFVALNGGPVFKFNEAVSFQIECDTQAEVDYYWEKLTAGGEKDAQQCGWLKDKFGVSWQVVAKPLIEMLKDHTSERARRAMKAMLEMKKFDIAALERAAG
jgi:predicted 3-demethylubiquinone-9 3-methyltransferase (glyoxalase superfamily)